MAKSAACSTSSCRCWWSRCARRWSASGCCPSQIRRGWWCRIASALDAAHARGIVHRDVKPENILLNAQGRALLTDFGIARDEKFLRATGNNRTLAATGLPVGTPEYMAPEQLRGTGGDTRIDGYSLGVVLYELLTGSPPFHATTPYEVASLVLGGQFVYPSERNPLIWPSLEHVVVRAMAADPDDRYPDMRSFALALREAVLHRDGRATAHRATNAMLPNEETVPLGPDAMGTFATPDVAARTEAMRPSWRLGVREGAPRSGRSVFVAASAIALVLVLACVLSGFAVLHGLMSPGGVASNGTPTSSRVAGTATAGTPIATATYGGPGVTPYPTFTPGGQPTPTGFGTPPAPTATTVGGELSLNPSTITLSPSGGSCAGMQTIANNGGRSVDWAWGHQPVPSGFGWHLGSAGTKYKSGTPSGTVSGNSTTTLYVRASCFAKGSYPETVTDSLGHNYAITLNVP